MAAAQIILVSGFLGAGKTTLINRLLQNSGGRRIAAVVNDFGAVNIDADLISETVDGVMSLKNGCICCSLQSDLIRTLSTLMKRDAQPEVIVIETSGVSNPKEIIAQLLDPVIFKATALDTVVTVIDAAYLVDSPALEDDDLWRAQVESADLLIINKAALLDDVAFEAVKERIRVRYPVKYQLDARADISELLLGEPKESGYVASDRTPSPRVRFPTDFETAHWTCDTPISLRRFQLLLDTFSRDLIRVKGFVAFAEMPEQTMLFQLVGTRATIVGSPVASTFDTKSVLVLIGRLGHDGVARSIDALDGLRVEAE